MVKLVKYVQLDIPIVIIDVLEKLKIAMNMMKMDYAKNVRIILDSSKKIEMNVLIKKTW